MVKWDGSCIVHEEFKAQGIADLQAVYPDAAVLVHPESPASVIALADVVGSTTALLKAVSQLDNLTFIVATDKGIFYKMAQSAPHKQFIAAPTAGNGASCKSCAQCPWMAMNSYELLINSLQQETNEIQLSDELISAAKVPLNRMLKFNR